MNYYFNENAFLKDKVSDGLPELLRDFGSIYKAVENNHGKLCLKDTFEWYNLVKFSDKSLGSRFVLPFQLFSRCDSISTEISSDKVLCGFSPQVNSEVIKETLSLCNRDRTEQMVSMPQDMDALEKIYYLEKAFISKVYNLKTPEEIFEYGLRNPIPGSIKEVFDRVSQKVPGISFSEKAYQTAAFRESAYRRVGYDKLIDVFRYISDYLLPFYRNQMSGKSEKMIFQELRDTYKIDISPESKATMRAYGKERDVTIEGKKYGMTNHIKFNQEACRIYFMYIEDKDRIYVGHSGGHLNTVMG